MTLPAGEDCGEFCGRCLLAAPPFSIALMRFAWREPASTLISGFKYHRRLACGRVLSELLAAQIAEEYRNRPLPQLLVPVPLHPRRLRARGYNQSLLIARRLGAVLQLPCSPSLLQRQRETPPQQGLSAALRKRNLAGAFRVSKQERKLLTSAASVALVDDVVTTMSTAISAAKALRRAAGPDTELHLWALARA